MPTSLPERRRGPRLDLFLVFVITLALSFLVIEIADPMPMDIEAAMALAP